MSSWTDLTGGITGNVGGIAGAVLGGPLGYVVGSKYDQNKKAKEEEDAAIAAAGAATAAEQARRAKNVGDVRAMYGEGPKGYDPTATAPLTFAQGALNKSVSPQNPLDPVKFAQYQTAQRMGNKLQGDIRGQASAVRELGTQQNLVGTSGALTEANATAAASGNATGSTGKMGQQAVMGGYLQGRQNVAGAVQQTVNSAQGALDAQRTAAENSAIGGAQEIDVSQALRSQANALNASRSAIPGTLIQKGLMPLGAGGGQAAGGSQADQSGFALLPSSFGMGRSSSGSFTQR